jgi:hypothetical protein
VIPRVIKVTMSPLNKQNVNDNYLRYIRILEVQGIVCAYVIVQL